jgi:23S rRNA (guanosine2251-2'-O)-methyltransferase
MASRSSPSGKRPRRPGERTEKERRAPQGPAGRSGGGPPGTGGPRDRHAGRAAGLPSAGPPSGGPGKTPDAQGQQPSLFGAPVSGATLIYGRNPVREALRGRRRVRTVWLGPGAPGDELEQSVQEWLAEGSAARPEIRHASPTQLTSMAGSPDHQGIVGAVDPYVYAEATAMLKDLSLLVALDEVQDPHNLGAIIRTAEGAGAGVIIPRHRAAEVTAAVVKASAGATEHASIAQVRNLADFLAEAKEAGFWVYGAAAGAAEPYTAQDYRYPTCFVVGSEGQGLGRRVASLCDVMVSLPLQGKLDSLNVSVSTGILLYEAVRQRVTERLSVAAGSPATQETAPAAPSAEAGASTPAAATPGGSGS